MYHPQQAKDGRKKLRFTVACHKLCTMMIDLLLQTVLQERKNIIVKELSSQLGICQYNITCRILRFSESEDLLVRRYSVEIAANSGN